MTLERRTPLKRTPFKRTPPKPRKANATIYQRGERGPKHGSGNSTIEFRGAEREAVEMRSKGRCEARTPVCQTKARHIHHIKMKSRRGKGNRENGLHVCAACHQYIHLNVAWATRHGMLVSATREGNNLRVVPACPADCMLDHAVDI